MTTLPVATIKVGERDREPGDVSGLMASMTEVGLLHPVVVTPDYVLVAGGRRLEAAKRLGWTEIDVTVIASLADAEAVLRAEMDENTCRRDLTPVEAERARTRRANAFASDADKRKKAGKPSPNLGEGRHSSETSRVAAIGTGYSGTTLDKVAKVREVAEDESRPEPVREVAREALDEMDRTHKVDAAHKRVKQADAYTRAVTDFPDLAHYADRPDKAVALAMELRTYTGKQREHRLGILRRNIDADNRRGHVEESPDYDHMAHLMFTAANQANQVIQAQGGVDTFTQAAAATDSLLSATWHAEFTSLASIATQIAKACKPAMRRVK